MTWLHFYRLNEATGDVEHEAILGPYEEAPRLSYRRVSRTAVLLDENEERIAQLNPSAGWMLIRDTGVFTDVSFHQYRPDPLIDRREEASHA